MIESVIVVNCEEETVSNSYANPMAAATKSGVCAVFGTVKMMTDNNGKSNIIIINDVCV